MYIDRDDQSYVDVFSVPSDESTPRILILGPPRSGVTSILMCIFEKRDQLETVFLQSTTELTRYSMYGGIEIFDLPVEANEHSYELTNISPFLSSNTIIIFVIDTQDDIQRSLLYLFSTMETAFRHQPDIQFHIFLHKIDGLSEELRQDINQDIQHRVLTNIDYEGWDSSLVQFHETSIYNKSIYEAMSRVSNKLIPNSNILENILTSLCYKSNLDKAYLFDIENKLFIATDSFPYASQYHQFCFDTVDLVEDLTSLSFQLNKNQTTDSKLLSLIQLDANFFIMTYQVSKLMLVCIVRDSVSRNISLLEFNAKKVSTSIKKVLEQSWTSSED
ncbi:hypothetical protein BB560_005312 [Smittium megazygosporum]|uniref:GTP-binding protein n=1 Tax=Smittium megazygosporum TaxID=133381 RepID=A0A2T9Z6U4_9FUNG|nr:hypothetical protein BB560_005312 [Smittium megazygosporum]